MAGKGFDAEYLSYFRRRKAELEKTPEKSRDTYRLEDVRSWIKKLSQ
jgi:hypothetical protein